MEEIKGYLSYYYYLTFKHVIFNKKYVHDGVLKMPQQDIWKDKWKKHIENKKNEIHYFTHLEKNFKEEEIFLIMMSYTIDNPDFYINYVFDDRFRTYVAYMEKVKNIEGHFHKSLPVFLKKMNKTFFEINMKKDINEIVKLVITKTVSIEFFIILAELFDFNIRELELSQMNKKLYEIKKLDVVVPIYQTFVFNNTFFKPDKHRLFSVLNSL